MPAGSASSPDTAAATTLPRSAVDAITADPTRALATSIGRDGAAHWWALPRCSAAWMRSRSRRSRRIVTSPRPAARARSAAGGPSRWSGCAACGAGRRGGCSALPANRVGQDAEPVVVVLDGDHARPSVPSHLATPGRGKAGDGGVDQPLDGVVKFHRVFPLRVMSRHGPLHRLGQMTGPTTTKETGGMRTVVGRRLRDVDVG
jgi:hypothetical protein